MDTHIIRSSIGSSVSTPWLLPLSRNSSARVRLLCFPYAGGQGTLFQSWVRRLPADVDLYGVQLPGRGNRFLEPSPKSIGTVIPDLVQAMLPLLDRPFAFFGHSLGAILSFEVARWLRSVYGAAPVCLFVSGRRAPHLPDTTEPTAGKSDAEFIERLRVLNGTPNEVLANPELLTVLLPSIRADFGLAETYRYVSTEPLSCPIVALGGEDDEETSDGRIEEWNRHTRRSFRIHTLRGGHFFMHEAEETLLSLLRQEIDVVAPHRAGHGTTSFGNGNI